MCKIDLSRAAINYSLEFEEQSRLKTMSHQILILHYDNNETKRNCHTFHVPQSIDINFPLSGISSTHLSIYPMNKITTTCEKDQWMHDKVQELIPRLKQISPSSLFLFFFNPVELNWTVDDTGEKCVWFVCYVRQFQLLKFDGGRESWCSSVTWRYALSKRTVFLV